SPDGRQLAIAGESGTVKVCAAATGEELALLQEHGFAMLCVAYSPDGRRLVAGGRGTTATVWDVRPDHLQDAVTSLLFRTADELSYVFQSAFSPDGKRLATAYYGWIKIREAETGKVLHTLQGVGMCVSFDPTGCLLAAVNPPNQTVQIWDVAAGKAVHILAGHTDALSGVAFRA